MADSLIRGAEREGAAAERIDLASLDIRPCRSCQLCQSSGHFLRCVMKDDVELVYEKMRQSDLIVFATPVYTFAMSSLLKILFERYYSTADIKKFRITKQGLLFHGIDDFLCGKPFVPLVVCDNLMDETVANTIGFFGVYAKFMDARQAGLLVRKSAGMIGPEGDHVLRERTAAAYFRAGQELARKGTVSAGTQRAANRSFVNAPAFLFREPFRRILSISQATRRKIVKMHHEMTIGATAVRHD